MIKIVALGVCHSGVGGQLPRKGILVTTAPPAPSSPNFSLTSGPQSLPYLGSGKTNLLYCQEYMHTRPNCLLIFYGMSVRGSLCQRILFFCLPFKPNLTAPPKKVLIELCFHIAIQR